MKIINQKMSFASKSVFTFSSSKAKTKNVVGIPSGSTVVTTLPTNKSWNC